MAPANSSRVPAIRRQVPVSAVRVPAAVQLPSGQAACLARGCLLGKLPAWQVATCSASNLCLQSSLLAKQAADNSPSWLLAELAARKGREGFPEGPQAGCSAKATACLPSSLLGRQLPARRVACLAGNCLLADVPVCPGGCGCGCMIKAKEPGAPGPSL
ncbi:hypothetical protein PCASD_19143 [Puccinia coronata f. sp. avenae]|uniref:Uncharacterized protein n=1 Tax=Puccinia coronata f. sp. avenae TaxID=200324 RepID=A0A2N5TQ66_9BASI|nr:hypothetical protein PCASD_19143 [Puccinia coronata f. sp. avenae]